MGMRQFLGVFLASTYIASLLGRRFELHWFRQCENSFDIDKRVFSTTRRPGQVFALQHWKQSQQRQCKPPANRQLKNTRSSTLL